MRVDLPVSVALTCRQRPDAPHAPTRRAPRCGRLALGAGNNGGDGKPMTTRIRTMAIGATVASALVAAPALAQKSKDTVRAISEQPISLVDSIYDPQPATTLM